MCESIGHRPLWGRCPKRGEMGRKRKKRKQRKSKIYCTREGRKESKKERNKKERKNRSPKGNMWSAIPVALLCMVVNQSERKQGSGPKRDKVL